MAQTSSSSSLESSMNSAADLRFLTRDCREEFILVRCQNQGVEPFQITVRAQV